METLVADRLRGGPTHVEEMIRNSSVPFCNYTSAHCSSEPSALRREGCRRHSSCEVQVGMTHYKKTIVSNALSESSAVCTCCCALKNLRSLATSDSILPFIALLKGSSPPIHTPFCISFHISFHCLFLDQLKDKPSDKLLRKARDPSERDSW